MASLRNAVVLLSGGLDSATTLLEAKAAGFTPCALSFRYGQRHAVELRCAEQLVRSLGVTRHTVLDINLRGFGGSALTSDLAVPKDRQPEDMAGEIPITYVPARNTIFLSFALAYAEVLDAADIFIGVNAIDYSGYPDCRPEYIAAFERMANLATKAAVEGRHLTLHTPLVQLTKAQIIRRGLELGVPFEHTSSCYDPDSTTGAACGRCDACVLRLKGFAEVGVRDLANYKT